MDKKVERFFADLRQGINDHHHLAERKSFIRSLYGKHQRQLPDSLCRFIEQGVLPHNSDPAYAAYNATQEGKSLRDLWCNTAMSRNCRRCEKLIPGRLLMEPRHEFCSTRCSALDPTSKARKEQALLKRFGVSHQSLSPAIQAKRRKTNQSRYGVTHPMQNRKVMAKMRRTMKDRYGVDHNMKCPEMRERQQASALRIHTVSLESGRQVRVQSKAEERVLGLLCQHFGERNVYSQFDEKFPRGAFKAMGTHPDFWVSSKKTFVEAKSLYTFMGADLGKGGVAAGSLKTNIKKARAANLNAKERWIVTNDSMRKGCRCVVLPEDWYSWKPRQIREYVLSRISPAK